ncbi:MAG TPA: lysophospholipid acyltransferase family protein [Chitinophagales bacterium]|nr:lysophospholipid acyltransferase family protein [Chitinophagales bacterium]
MGIFKRIFGFIWAIWGAMWFMVVITIFTPIYAVIFALFGKKYSMNCVWINTHYLSPFLMAMCLIRRKEFGKEKIRTDIPYVFVSNHLSQVDIITSGSSVPQPVRFLAKSEIKKIPLFGSMTKMLAIMVDRKSKESREKSMIYMMEELRRGNSIFIYPEGTRNRTEQPLKEFKDGAFKLAIMAQAPVAVQTLIGTKKVNNPVGIQLYPGTVEVYWGDPIETTGMTDDDLPRLKELVRTEMLKHLLA